MIFVGFGPSLRHFYVVWLLDCLGLNFLASKLIVVYLSCLRQYSSILFLLIRSELIFSRAETLA